MNRAPAVTAPQVAETDRAAPLRAFLREVHARCMWQQRIENVGTVSCYAANGRVFIVQVFHRGKSSNPVEGWDVFIPADTSGKIDSTLDAVRAYIEGRNQSARDRIIAAIQSANLSIDDIDAIEFQLKGTLP